MKKNDDIMIHLSADEMRLVLDYGYPFEEIERQVKGHSGGQNAALISASRFEWEQVVGHLSISVNEGSADFSILQGIDLLAEKIEGYLSGMHRVVKL